MAQLTQFVYPAVFVKGEEVVVASFPDIGITTDGFSFEEAFLLAKDYLRVYCTYVCKYELDTPKPSFYEDVSSKNMLSSVMLVDTVIFPNDIK